MRRWITLSAVFAAFATAYAAEVSQNEPGDPPRSIAAKEALRTLDSAKRKAQQDFDQAIRVANTRAVKDLTAAEGAAARGGNKDEVARIKAAISELTAVTSTFTIAADKPWQTTVHVRKFQTVRIKATGTWNGGYGATGPEGTGGMYGLIGKIGTGEPFDIAPTATLTADQDGDLVMQMKDKGLKDNSGALQVEVSVG